ncbi:hypothetical protein RJ641_033265 [Dillenia turbinata]|uniref:Lycopene beta-cyclase n=1 Tax=Dillenia turbinata TaxID=194707 RepID=A0AAN8VL78_9MAGN
MGTIPGPFPPLATLNSRRICSYTHVIPFSKTQTSSRKSYSRICCSKYGSFLDMKPKYEPESLDFDIPFYHPTDRCKFDAIIIGAGPAGLRLAEQVSFYGISVCCVDPSPLSMWHNNYGAWVDEFEGLGLESCLDKKWPMTRVYIDDHKSKFLDRSYGRVGRKELKTKLMEGCVSNGVKFYEGKVWKVEHQEFESSVLCDDGNTLRASLIVDASGFTSTFIEYNKRRNAGFQIAHGILAEVESHPFDLDKMVLMDWRDSHLGNEPYLRANNTRLPTFLYAMPFSSNLIFLEETSLVSRPVLSYKEVKSRMVARLRHLGIKVKRVLEDEKCLIPMGGPLPQIPQSVMAIGGNSGLVHPSTGYLVARTLAVAPILAAAIAECLGSTRMIRGKSLYYKVWNGLWPIERKCIREFYCFGMETLLKLDLKGTRRFFDAFFDLTPYYWHGFLSSRLSLQELIMLSVSLFGHASNLSREDRKKSLKVEVYRSIVDFRPSYYHNISDASCEVDKLVLEVFELVADVLGKEVAGALAVVDEELEGVHVAGEKRGVDKLVSEVFELVMDVLEGKYVVGVKVEVDKLVLDVLEGKYVVGVKVEVDKLVLEVFELGVDVLEGKYVVGVKLEDDKLVSEVFELVVDMLEGKYVVGVKLEVDKLVLGVFELVVDALEGVYMVGEKLEVDKLVLEVFELVVDVLVEKELEGKYVVGEKLEVDMWVREELEVHKLVDLLEVYMLESVEAYEMVDGKWEVHDPEMVEPSSTTLARQTSTNTVSTATNRTVWQAPEYFPLRALMIKVVHTSTQLLHEPLMAMLRSKYLGLNIRVSFTGSIRQ